MGRAYVTRVLGVVCLATPAAAEDGPRIVPASIVVTARSHDGYAKKPKDPHIRSWTPAIEMTIAGPVEAGSQLVAEFGGGKPWATILLKTPELAAGKTAKVEGGSGDDVPRENASIATGEVPFKIRLKNELNGTDQVLYKGTFTVEKFAGNEPQRKNGSFEYFVDQDFWLPYGTVGLDDRDPKAPVLIASMWTRGRLWQGKDVAYLFYDGKQFCNTSSDASGVIQGPSFTNSPGGESRTWQRGEIYFNCARAFSSYPADYGVHEPQFHLLDKHPGKYEIKLMRSGKLSREMAFTVGEGGKIAETGFVPVKVLVDSEDGQKLDRNAWKKGIYGKPVAGFAP